jgi:hypothetical protein
MLRIAGAFCLIPFGAGIGVIGLTLDMLAACANRDACGQAPPSTAHRIVKYSNNVFLPIRYEIGASEGAHDRTDRHHTWVPVRCSQSDLPNRTRNGYRDLTPLSEQSVLRKQHL